jgi:uncharacterized integral membrane protein
MLRKIVTVLILVPLAVVLVAFAVANRQLVTVSFDPFDQAHPAFALTVPLYALVLALVIAGVIIGGVAAWATQGKWRRAARRAQSRAHQLNTELDRHRQRPPSASPPAGAPRLVIPPPAGMSHSR